MIKTEYIPSENTEVLYKLLNNCKKEYPSIIFYIYDTESFVCKSKNVDEIIEAIDGGDEEIGINCWVDGELIGWFGVLPYESEDIIFDCSDNNFCKRMLND